MQPAVVDDEFADVFENELQDALQGVTHGMLVFGRPLKARAQFVETLTNKLGGDGGALPDHAGELTGFVRQIRFGEFGLCGDAIEQTSQ